MPEGFVKLLTLAREVGLTKEHIRSFARRGDLHVVRLGKSVLVPPDEAAAFRAFIDRIRVSQPDPNRLRGAYCQSAPGHRCVCGCHQTRAGKAKPGANTRWDSWLRHHDALLTDLVEQGHPPDVIAPIISERFSVPRTGHAVGLRIRKLGLSRRDGWMSREDVERLLGISHQKRMERYEAQGYLPTAAYGRWRRIRRADVERLVRDQAGVTIDPRRIIDPTLKALAETAAIVNRRRVAS